MPAIERSTCTPPRVALCVPTHRRPAGLARLLGSLESLVFPDGAPELRVVVVDNDPDGSAAAVCETLAERSSYPIAYSREKRRGISHARNAALVAAMGTSDFVAFLDDDEVPEPEWLSELLRAQRAHAADAVTGPSLSAFVVPPPDWAIAAGFFTRPRWSTGTEVGSGFTGNALFRTAALGEMAELFDERLALTGGEDSEFFQRFARAGYRVVWCDSAIVHDEVPVSCTRLRWILARGFRTGGSETYIQQKLEPGWRTRLRVVLHAGWCIAKGCALVVAGALRGRATAAAGLRLACFGAGRIAGLAGLQYAEYRTTHGN